MGLRFAPIGSAVPNLGVEHGATNIVEKLPRYFTGKQSLVLQFPEPESLSADRYLTQVFEQYLAAKYQLLAAWPLSTSLVALGGDHSTAFISLAAVMERYSAANVAVIMFDSHADLHQAATSPTGNFHGMWLRSLCDSFPLLNDQGYSRRLDPTQLRFVGNLLTEAAEVEFIAQHEIQIYDSSRISLPAANQLVEWAATFPHLHVSFDVDVFDQTLVSATGTPNPNGLTMNEVMMMLQPLAAHGSISLDIVEHNPHKPEAVQTLPLIERILQTLL
ncbi:MAG: arginase family protein [bacterium]|nr:arginase family protein [bacterium]